MQGGSIRLVERSKLLLTLNANRFVVLHFALLTGLARITGLARVHANAVDAGSFHGALVVVSTSQFCKIHIKALVRFMQEIPQSDSTNGLIVFRTISDLY